MRSTFILCTDFRLLKGESSNEIPSVLDFLSQSDSKDSLKNLLLKNQVASSSRDDWQMQYYLVNSNETLCFVNVPP